MGEEGSEVSDLTAARSKAIREARGIMCAEVAEGRLCLGCRVEVADAQGSVVLTVPFSEAITITGRHS